MLRHISGESHLMCDDDHRQTIFGKGSHDFQNLSDHLRVEGGCRLVKEQDLGFHRKGSCDRYPLLLSTGKLFRLCIDVWGHADFFEIHHCVFVCLFFAFFEDFFLSDCAVFENCHIVKKVKVLEHHADFGAVLRNVHVFVHDVCSVVADLAG